jgi:two-component system alkaline phosphatase synthesis response regulator PhoP
MMKKILVVDDEPYIVKLIESRLKANDYEVIVSYDGEEGLAKAIQSLPDLIILDIMMPKMDGPAIAEAIRANPKTARIPIIFLTALVKKTETENTDHVIGGQYFIAKPFKPEELLATIKSVLQKKA